MQVNETVAIAFAALLNEALKCDPYAISSLCNHRIACDSRLVRHPTVQVERSADADKVGMLGVINGICERVTGHKIAAVYDNEYNKALVTDFIVVTLDECPNLQGGN